MENLMAGEIWKPISINPKYAVSSYGKIKRLDTEKILQTICKSAKYNQINLLVNGKRKTLKVHWLVTEAFLGKRPNNLETNHKDGNKRNNHINNLEYVTSSENNRHAYKTGLKKPTPPRLGEACNKAKLKKQDVIIIKKLRKRGHTTVALGKMFGVSHSAISLIVNNKNWRWLGEENE